MKQGDIVIVSFPFTDLKQSKPRPAVIISTSKLDETQDVVLVQITSKSYRDEFSFFIDRASLSVPLEKISQVRCHKIFTVEKSFIKKTVSSFNSSQKAELLSKIRSYFDFED